MRKTFKERRKELGLTVEQLAERADISPREVQSIEQGKHKPRLEISYNLFKILCGEDGRVYYEWSPLKLSEAREQMNMTQATLAKEIGVSRRSVNRWESIRKPSLPSKKQFVMLSRLLGMKKGDFFICRDREACLRA